MILFRVLTKKLVSDDLVQSVDQNIAYFHNCRVNFHKIQARFVLYEIKHTRLSHHPDRLWVLPKPISNGYRGKAAGP
jgi:hypothetical protein